MTTTQMATLNPAQVPAAFHSLMQQMQASELSQNVGANYAVVSFKGKVFRIKHGGTEYPITIQFNGQEYAAPFLDVVIPLANPALSKTYYASGYTEGSDEAPTCWPEDGRNPLAPMENRPIVPQTGQHCTDCLLCPMNAFGSKINQDTGKGGKACADTRKLVVVPLDANGNVDTENARYGGPMLMRVPAASLSVFAEYDRKLQAMGVPYFAVVTRMQFDSTVAYPKFQLTPARMITEAEANEILGLRNSQQVQAILGGGHASAPALAAPAPAELAAPAPAAAPPAPMAIPTAAPVAAPPPATAIPTPAPVYAPPAPVAPAAPPAVPMAPPPAAFPAAPPAPVQAAPAPTAAFPGFPALAPAAPAQMAPQIAYPPATDTPAPAPAAAQPEMAVNPELLGRINQLLDS
jgi:hypothetical protein